MAAIGYTYSGGRLSQLDRKTYRSGAAQHQYYYFAYNVWGQTTATKVGSRTLSTNTYYNYNNDDTARGGNLKSTAYANGDSVSYTYDRFDRLVRKSYNSGNYAAYTYNAEGSLARLSYGDSTGELASYRFEYDSLGRLIRSAELDADGSTVQRTEHIYDGYNRLSRQSWTLGDKTYSESYVYDDPSDTNQNGDGASDTNKNGDGALTQMTTATGAVIDYQYDTLRRLTRSKVALNGSAVYTTAYAFRDLDASRTTTQVQYRNVRNANGEVLEGKKYTYDALGNITRISQSTGHFYPLVAYEYDAQNQLTKETYYNGEGTAAGNITRTISYTYDTAGNILSETRTEDGETTTKTYGYGDSDWADLLTEVDGQAITYDASGNPTSYFGRTMTWTNGRQLKTSTTHALGSVLKSTYTYDADGIRKTKTVPINRRGLTCTYTFVTQNGKIVKQSWRTESIDFFYDESGRPFAMTYQRANDAPQTYYYVLNLQGDVVKLVDVSGAEVASYEYDAWGNVLSQSGSMAGVNPLRYRGYYRDSETGFYYLQSRYYDPANHRFINADVYASTGQGFVGTNMFAYCNNNPVVYSDYTGDESVAAVLSLGYFIKALATVAVITIAVYCIAITAGPYIANQIGVICENIGNLINERIAQIDEGMQQFARVFDELYERFVARLSISYAGVSRGQLNTNPEVHHIVAQGDYRARRARGILNAVGIRVNDSINLIPLKSHFHRRLHSNAYYNWVDKVITSAYYSGDSYAERRRNVMEALYLIRSSLDGINRCIPY